MSKIAVFGSYPESLLNFRGHLLKAMVNAGHEVHTVSPPANPDIVAQLNRLGVTHHTVPLSRTGLNPIHDMKSLFALTGLFRQMRPDHLLAYTIKPVVYGGMAARLIGIRYYPMITGLGYAFSGKGKKGRLIKRLVSFLHKIALHSAKRTIFQNSDNLHYFQNQGLLRTANKATLVNGSGVDLEYFNVEPFPGTTNFLMIARLLRDKGVVEYVNAARQIRAIHPNIKFRLAGWIDDTPAAISHEELNNWIEEGTIEYLGHLKDVRQALRDCAVYVLPSYYPEGIPRTLLEAMSMGRPIITTDMPGCRETVTKDKNGFLVPAKNTRALADAMQKFLDQPELIGNMGQASRQLAEGRFDVHKVNQEILETMELT